MADLTGEISGWGIFSLRKRDGSVLTMEGEVVQALIGDVVVDYRARFQQGDWFLSSRIVSFDKHDRLVETQNSTYKLHGRGYKICGTQRFFDLFAIAGISSAIDALPGECEVLEEFV
ncbi:DUF6957 family protein [Photobacterium lipolyticum]|uniref:DUF6957 domain-containing protein n=1 Tax=Photobacterium lipolyticum TaxID=266810 RepID=A0A2T3MW42_9GAMM|nr:hypothetical protein [Photobacterium lipolyticum]PSW04192.1 hypothetical protein C9I89_14535 [Photobacterium lipolyticum]